MLSSIDVSGETFTIVSASPGDTMRVGAQISRTLNEDDVIFVSGDLGVGKTVLVKGMASGLGVPKDEHVLSPSYTLLRTYHGKLVLHHIDLYRITKPYEAADIVAMAEDGVLIIEWPEHGDGFLPESTLKVELIMREDERRRISLSGPSRIISNMESGH